MRVNALAPGYLPTRADRPPGRRGLAGPSASTRCSRAPEMHELDGPLLFLATAASSYMTGQVLVIDGGWTAV